ncbi:MAG: hypothetical protein K2J61_05415 [Clostridia bacterium]|nr:hypothetical protein [Clostridia bacterium]
MKKIFAIIAAILIACFTFAGCAQTNEPPAGTDGNTTTETETEKEEITKMYITIDGNKLEVTLADNAAAKALAEKLKKGDITYTANDFGGFEKVGSLGFYLPSDDAEITTQSGDVILYSSNQIVLFYGSNTWAYTRLGTIDGYTSTELRTLLCAGKNNVQVILSLK